MLASHQGSNAQLSYFKPEWVSLIGWSGSTHSTENAKPGNILGHVATLECYEEHHILSMPDIHTFQSNLGPFLSNRAAYIVAVDLEETSIQLKIMTQMNIIRGQVNYKHKFAYLYYFFCHHEYIQFAFSPKFVSDYQYLPYPHTCRMLSTDPSMHLDHSSVFAFV